MGNCLAVNKIMGGMERRLTKEEIQAFRCVLRKMLSCINCIILNKTLINDACKAVAYSWLVLNFGQKGACWDKTLISAVICTKIVSLTQYLQPLSCTLAEM